MMSLTLLRICSPSLFGFPLTLKGHEPMKDLRHMIFVFGSNRSGIHGAGAARYAAVHKGAVWGVGEGPTGACYALPTKGFNITQISLDQVRNHVNQFLAYARDHDYQDFQVTQIGCGLGGFTKEQIAPMFEFAPLNCYFDIAWKHDLPEHMLFWGTF
jgi:hypothetical protein